MLWVTLGRLKFTLFFESWEPDFCVFRECAAIGHLDLDRFLCCDLAVYFSRQSLNIFEVHYPGPSGTLSFFGWEMKLLKSPCKCDQMCRIEWAGWWHDDLRVVMLGTCRQSWHVPCVCLCRTCQTATWECITQHSSSEMPTSLLSAWPCASCQLCRPSPTPFASTKAWYASTWAATTSATRASRLGRCSGGHGWTDETSVPSCRVVSLFEFYLCLYSWSIDSFSC